MSEFEDCIKKWGKRERTQNGTASRGASGSCRPPVGIVHYLHRK